MKSKILFAVASLAVSLAALADDQVRNVQTQLKSLGFYYDEINGQKTPETNMAVRRYQIRNGLEVTGTLTPETLKALGLTGQPKAADTPPAIAVQPAKPEPPKSKPVPPVDLRKDESAEQSDRNFLRREEGTPRRPEAPPSNDPSVIPPPAPLDAPSADFPVLFAGTPYANAPVTVQQQTLRRAQGILASRGFYRDIVDGLPGPATEEALLTYQRAVRLILTGRLDMDTLAALRLLPNAGPGVRFEAEFGGPRHVFRGIWIGH